MLCSQYVAVSSELPHERHGRIVVSPRDVQCASFVECLYVVRDGVPPLEERHDEVHTFCVAGEWLVLRSVAQYFKLHFVRSL